jgi:tetratricopeptide (TPR) repeat protein
MAPARTDEEELTVGRIERIGARRLAEIVVNHCYRDEGLRQAVRIALAALAPGDPLVEMLAAEIDAIRADRHFYEYGESGVLASEIDRIREGITAHLLPTQPLAAAELLGRVIRLDESVFERSDDSDGVIGDAIDEAVADCGRAWAAVPERDPRALAAEVFDLFVSDDYGARGRVIPAFAEALGASGLDELERMVRERLDLAPSGKNDYRRYGLTAALTDIADARGDVDGYIAAQRLAGTEDAAAKEIGERLLAAGRLEEALARLDRPGIPEHRLGEIGRLKVEILERLGRSEEAQAVRWSMFTAFPSMDILNEYLGRLPQDAVAEARRKAIAIAGQYPDLHRSLHLLAELDPDTAADLVHRRLDEISGDSHWSLRPVAERLAETQPLAAILLYRRMADAVLRRGHSQHYDQAVRDLVAAENLVPNVEDWLGQPSQEAYRQQVATEYRRKRAFWERMGRAGLSWRQ